MYISVSWYSCIRCRVFSTTITIYPNGTEIYFNNMFRNNSRSYCPGIRLSSCFCTFPLGCDLGDHKFFFSYYCSESYGKEDTLFISNWRKPCCQISTALCSFLCVSERFTEQFWTGRTVVNVLALPSWSPYFIISHVACFRF
jgi:hypothetical protein